jgi:hypothetical protein
MRDSEDEAEDDLELKAGDFSHVLSAHHRRGKQRG